MIYKLFLTMLFACSSFLSFAQVDKNNHPRKGEKYESMKIAFLTNKLSLDPETAQAFWPVYNEYQEQKNEMRSQSPRGKNDKDLSKGNAEIIVHKILESKQKELDLEKAFVAKLGSILKAEQLLTLLTSEREFKHQVLDRFKKRRRSGQK